MAKKTKGDDLNVFNPAVKPKKKFKETLGF